MQTKKQINLASAPEWANFDIVKFRVPVYSTICWINHYPVGIVNCFVNTYPLDSNLYNG